jgi:uncharacterized protein (TIGR02145 family)
MKTIQIGSQVWTRKNLRVFKFRNGHPIPIIQDPDEWVMLQESAMCINPENGEFYYNWYAVNDPRGLAPEGFHVPSNDEWQQLVDYCGGNEKAGNLLKSTKKWDGTGPIKGFNAIPSGFRAYYDGNFYDQGNNGHWWSSSPSGTHAWNRNLNSEDPYVFRDSYYAQNGLSVRLIKD